jgi:hypothetical protein
MEEQSELPVVVELASDFIDREVWRMELGEK